MKNIFKWVLLLFCLSCSQENNNLFEDIALNGGYIEFTNGIPEARFNILDLPEDLINTPINDPNNNALSYKLTLVYNDTQVENFLEINAFPSDLVIKLQSVLDALSLTTEDLTSDTEFQFIANVTTPSGIFSGLNPDFNTDTNTQEGGSIGPGSLETNNDSAMTILVTFFIPPPRKIRGTSFEEAFAAADPEADYVRADGEGNDDEGELFNHDGERHVMHTAVGNGVDDEIGFRSFFFSNGGGGFSNEEIGVTQKIEDVGSYVDGIQGFQLEDVDGLFRLLFDKVEINPTAEPLTGVRIQVFFRSTSWEDEDRIRIYAEIKKDGEIELIELLNLIGPQIDEIEDKWNVIDSGFLEDVTSYQLIIDSEIDSSSEEIYFDEMLVYGPDN